MTATGAGAGTSRYGSPARSASPITDITVAAASAAGAAIGTTIAAPLATITSNLAGVVGGQALAAVLDAAVVTSGPAKGAAAGARLGAIVGDVATQIAAPLAVRYTPAAALSALVQLYHEVMPAIRPVAYRQDAVGEPIPEAYTDTIEYHIASQRYRMQEAAALLPADRAALANAAQQFMGGMQRLYNRAKKEMAQVTKAAQRVIQDDVQEELRQGLHGPVEDLIDLPAFKGMKWADVHKLMKGGYQPVVNGRTLPPLPAVEDWGKLEAKWNTKKTSNATQRSRVVALDAMYTSAVEVIRALPGSEGAGDADVEHKASELLAAYHPGMKAPGELAYKWYGAWYRPVKASGEANPFMRNPPSDSTRAVDVKRRR